MQQIAQARRTPEYQAPAEPDLPGEVAFVSADEQAQRSVELLGAGAMLITLPPPIASARGRLGELLEELVERELARLGAPSPYLAAWSATTEDATARLADQLYRARAVGNTGLAIAMGSLRAIARPTLATDDSATLRWLADATVHAPVVLLVDDADETLLGWSAPLPLVAMLSRPRLVLPSPPAPIVWESAATMPGVEALGTPEIPVSAVAMVESLDDDDAPVFLDEVTQVDARVAPVEPIERVDGPPWLADEADLAGTSGSAITDADDARPTMLEARPSVAPEELAVLVQDAESAAEHATADAHLHAADAHLHAADAHLDAADAHRGLAPLPHEAVERAIEVAAGGDEAAPTTMAEPDVQVAAEPEPVAAEPEPVAAEPALVAAEPAKRETPAARRARRRAAPVDAERARERVTVGIPVAGPDDTWRSWVLALGAAKGAQPLAAFERLFVESYVPLGNAIAAGLDDARALRAYDEFRRSFERSYTDAFATFGATNRRPRLVMDAFDFATKQSRLVGARQTHVLLVDSLRYDLGCLVRDALARETAGIAAPGGESILFSALPTTTTRQLETLGRGMDALRAPHHEEPSESLRGRSAEVVRRVRLGSRELYKLDIVPAMLEEMAFGEQIEQAVAFERIATACAEAIARHVSTLAPRTFLLVLGDHGFAVDRRGAVQLGGASPEEVLVPAFGWLVGDQH